MPSPSRVADEHRKRGDGIACSAPGQAMNCAGDTVRPSGANWKPRSRHASVSTLPPSGPPDVTTRSTGRRRSAANAARIIGPPFDSPSMSIGPPARSASRRTCARQRGAEIEDAQPPVVREEVQRLVDAIAGAAISARSSDSIRS